MFQILPAGSHSRTFSAIAMRPRAVGGCQCGEGPGSPCRVACAMPSKAGAFVNHRIMMRIRRSGLARDM